MDPPPSLPAQFMVKVTPRAAKNEVIGWADGVLRVRISAPPVEGKANEALLRLLSEYSGLPASAFTLVRGHTSRLKLIRRTTAHP